MREPRNRARARRLLIWRRRFRTSRCAAAGLLLFAAHTVRAAGDEEAVFQRTEQRQQCDNFNPLRRPYFGDLHVHTAFSLDARTQDTRNTPRDAYRFARGARLGIQPYDAAGKPLRSLQLARPLDFVAVTDHAELYGELSICETPGAPGYHSPICVMFRHWPRLAFFLINARSSASKHPSRFNFCGENGAHCLRAAAGTWREIRAAAEGAYDRTSACTFTTFVGYEWTGGPDSNNIHRNVIFRNDVVPELPVSYFEAQQPTRLWKRLDAACRQALPGCDFLAIPHNSNLSGGLMFQTAHPNGSPMTMNDALARAAYEPLVEVMQHKGDSECRLGPGTEDELCGFEKLPYDNFKGKFIPWLAHKPAASNFIRDALEEGLLQEERTGANPFRFGLIASTDTHLGTPGAVREKGHPGHGGAGTPASVEGLAGLPDNIEFNPGGLAVLWAEENSRDALFAAMRRREAYGTSGPRITVRFFGGWRYTPAMCAESSFAEQGYAGGVPMGGLLPARASPSQTGPTFALWALRDPGGGGDPGTPLQRAQVVKGWVENGAVREKVYEVAGDPHNGARVDPGTCTAAGAGFDSLCTVWTDPEFDSVQRAFYYARVLENPTCRWSTYVCNAHGVNCKDTSTVTAGLEPCCDTRYPKTIQERAWTSPIWYSPPGKRGKQGPEGSS